MTFNFSCFWKHDFVKFPFPFPLLKLPPTSSYTSLNKPNWLCTSTAPTTLNPTMKTFSPLWTSSVEEMAVILIPSEFNVNRFFLLSSNFVASCVCGLLPQKRYRWQMLPLQPSNFSFIQFFKDKPYTSFNIPFA